MVAATNEFVRMARLALAQLPVDGSALLNRSAIQAVRGRGIGVERRSHKGAGAQELDSLPQTFLHDFAFWLGPPALEQGVINQMEAHDRVRIDAMRSRPVHARPR
jgi:hypothetical protein